MHFLKRLLHWADSNADNLLATLALSAIAVGSWMAWPPLGFIVPGSIVFACLAYSRVASRRSK